MFNQYLWSLLTLLTINSCLSLPTGPQNKDPNHEIAQTKEAEDSPYLEPGRLGESDATAENKKAMPNILTDLESLFSQYPKKKPVSKSKNLGIFLDLENLIQSYIDKAKANLKKKITDSIASIANMNGAAGATGSTDDQSNISGGQIAGDTGKEDGQMIPITQPDENESKIKEKEENSREKQKDSKQKQESSKQKQESSKQKQENSKEKQENSEEKSKDKSYKRSGKESKRSLGSGELSEASFGTFEDTEQDISKEENDETNERESNEKSEEDSDDSSDKDIINQFEPNLDYTKDIQPQIASMIQEKKKKLGEKILFWKNLNAMKRSKITGETPEDVELDESFLSFINNETNTNEIATRIASEMYAKKKMMLKFDEPKVSELEDSANEPTEKKPFTFWGKPFDVFQPTKPQILDRVNDLKLQLAKNILLKSWIGKTTGTTTTTKNDLQFFSFLNNGTLIDIIVSRIAGDLDAKKTESNKSTQGPQTSELLDQPASNVIDSTDEKFLFFKSPLNFSQPLGPQVVGFIEKRKEEVAERMLMRKFSGVDEVSSEKENKQDLDFLNFLNNQTVVEQIANKIAEELGKKYSIVQEKKAWIKFSNSGSSSGENGEDTQPIVLEIGKSESVVSEAAGESNQKAAIVEEDDDTSTTTTMIVVGCVAAVCIVIAVASLVYRRNKQQNNLYTKIPSAEERENMKNKEIGQKSPLLSSNEFSIGKKI